MWDNTAVLRMTANLLFAVAAMLLLYGAYRYWRIMHPTEGIWLCVLITSTSHSCPLCCFFHGMQEFGAEGA